MSILLALADDIAADRRINAEDALRLRKEIFPDGIVSRQEADVLVALAGRVADHDDAWTAAFVEAIADHVLQSGPVPGHIDAAATQWLKASFAHDAPTRCELEALLQIAERAESAPPALHELVRGRLARYVAGRAITAADVELVRRCVYADVAVTEDEVQWLFALDAESDGRDNDPAWRDLFVKASLCSVAGRSAPVFDVDAMLAREARFAARAPVSPLSVLASITKGGFAGFMSHVREPGAVESLERDYDSINSEAEWDTKLTVPELASMLGLSDADGKRTANEEALLAELNKLEAEQGPR